MGAFDHLRVCDFGGQLAGAGGTKLLAMFGAEVIRRRGSGDARGVTS